MASTIFIITILILLAVGGLKYHFQNQKMQKLLESEISKKHVESQLINLKNQLNPHFLFNSFNTLIALIEDDQQKAIYFTEKLTEFYRLLLVNSKEELIKFSREIELVEAYCDILNVRFGNSIRLTIQNRQLDTYIPPLAIQLLIENVVKHNELSKKNIINIDIYFDGKSIIISNDKKLKITNVLSTKHGINNIKKRYELLSKKTVYINDWDDRFEVKLPLLRKNKIPPTENSQIEHPEVTR